MKFAVLGYGPAGLIAAKTLVDEGHTDIDIIGAGPKSVIGGAQYLHEPILNSHQDPDGEITFIKIGERDGYAEKVYGDPGIGVSWDHYDGVVPAWSLMPVYDVLWDHFRDSITQQTLDWAAVVAIAKRYDMIFSSIPMHALCCPMSEHRFARVSIALVPFSPMSVNNVVLYSGRPGDIWYRTSCIFGEKWSEFGPSQAKLAATASYVSEVIEGAEEIPVHHGFKPLVTDCDCLPEVTRIGRFGLWDRKVLLHHVPQQVRAALDEELSI